MSLAQRACPPAGDPPVLPRAKPVVTVAAASVTRRTSPAAHTYSIPNVRENPGAAGLAAADEPGW